MHKSGEGLEMQRGNVYHVTQAVRRASIQLYARAGGLSFDGVSLLCI